MRTIDWLTYGQLFSVMRSHGFTSRLVTTPDGWKGLLWEHPHGAKTPMPVMDEDDPVVSYHYGAIRADVVDFDIMTREAFELALLQAAHRLPTSA